jgi:hypothetical protein
VALLPAGDRELPAVLAVVNQAMKASKIVKAVSPTEALKLSR